MILDASFGGILRAKTDEELKMLIDNMCQNEYHSVNEQLNKKVFIQLI